jgi:HEAT repeat protein
MLAAAGLAWLLAAEPAGAAEHRPRALLLNACAGAPQPQYWMERLGAEDPRARAAAAAALGELRDPVAVPVLARALRDPDPAVRLSAAKALGRIGPDAGAAVAALEQLLAEPDPALRQAAAVSLGRIRGR